MNKEVSMIDFSLPNNPDTLKFIKLNQSDKLKAVSHWVCVSYQQGHSNCKCGIILNGKHA